MRRQGLLTTIEAVHAAGLDAGRWPQALEAIRRMIGGRGATLETIDRATLQHRLFLARGLPPPGEMEYLDHYAALNIRLPSHLCARPNDVIYDYGVFDEETMRRAPFYAEFLPRFGCRYFISGIVDLSEQELIAVTVQRSPQQGHVDGAEIALMRRLVPHVRQAFDVTRRLAQAADARGTLERTLDWLADCVALLQADGKVIYANESFHGIVRRKEGIRLSQGMIEFADAGARDKLNAALAAILRLRAGAADNAAADFAAMRPGGTESYFVSVRPLIDGCGPSRPSQAVAIVLVRDPLGHDAATSGALRDLFGFTRAEAALARALQSGVTLKNYARKQAVSLNTVYTHLRRLREKTGCTRMAELIHKLNELRLPLRPD